MISPLLFRSLLRRLFKIFSPSTSFTALPGVLSRGSGGGGRPVSNAAHVRFSDTLSNPPILETRGVLVSTVVVLAFRRCGIVFELSVLSLGFSGLGQVGDGRGGERGGDPVSGGGERGGDGERGRGDRHEAASGRRHQSSSAAGGSNSSGAFRSAATLARTAPSGSAGSRSLMMAVSLSSRAL